MKTGLFAAQLLAQLLIWVTISTRLVFAQGSVTVGPTTGGQSARGFVATFNEVIIYPLIILMLAAAMLVFFYGGFEYVLRADNDAARDTGRKHMLWGLIGLLVMVSAMTILRIAAATFGLEGQLDSSL